WKPQNICRLRVCHQLRHAMRMCPINMTVRIENQFAAVTMALPFGDDFHVYAPLNRASDEHSAERPLADWRITQSPTSSGQRLLRVGNLKYARIVQFPFAQSCEQRPHLRKNRNRKTCARFVAISDDLSGCK